MRQGSFAFSEWVGSLHGWNTSHQPSRAPGNETDTNSQEGEIKHSSITDDSKNESLVTLKKTFIQLDVILFSVGTQWAIKIKMNLGNETAVWEMFAKKLFHYFLKRQMVLQFDTRLRPQMFLKWKGPTSHMEVPSTCVSECGESLRINVLMFLYNVIVCSHIG